MNKTNSKNKWGSKSTGQDLFHMCTISNLIRPEDNVLIHESTPIDIILKLSEIYPKVEFHILSDASLSTLPKNVRFLSTKEIEGLKKSFNLVLGISNNQLVEDYFTFTSKFILEDGAFYIFGISDKNKSKCTIVNKSKNITLGGFSGYTSASTRTPFREWKSIFSLPIFKISFTSYLQFIKLKLCSKVQLKKVQKNVINPRLENSNSDLTDLLP